MKFNVDVVVVHNVVQLSDPQYLKLQPGEGLNL